MTPAELVELLSHLADVDVEELELRRHLRTHRRTHRRILAALPDEQVTSAARLLRELQPAPAAALDRPVFERLVRDAAEQVIGGQRQLFLRHAARSDYTRLEALLPRRPEGGSPDHLREALGRLDEAKTAPELPGTAEDWQTLAALLLWADELAGDGYRDARTQP
jgi:hypothetical protein